MKFHGARNLCVCPFLLFQSSVAVAIHADVLKRISIPPEMGGGN